jgi:hypothetical protein
MDNLAHKMLHTFEKMDAINPTFEKTRTCTSILIKDQTNQTKDKHKTSTRQAQDT